MPTMIEFKCEICGKVFSRTKKDVTKNGGNIRTCSRTCRGEMRSRHLNDVKPTVTCDICGKSFKKKQSDINRSENNFCSRECYGKSLAKLYDSNRVQVECKQCKKSYKISKCVFNSRKNFFCSNECLWESKREHLTAICSYCGKEFPTVRSRLEINHHNYCSNDCRLSNWLNIISINDSGYSVKRSRLDGYRILSEKIRGNKIYRAWRTEVKKRDNHTCTVCGERSNIQVHHANTTMYEICKIHGYDFERIIHSEELLNIDNGVTLCHKCHIKEHNSLIQRDTIE